LPEKTNLSNIKINFFFFELANNLLKSTILYKKYKIGKVSNTRKIHKALKPQNSMLTTKKLETKNQQQNSQGSSNRPRAAAIAGTKNQKSQEGKNTATAGDQQITNFSQKQGQQQPIRRSPNKQTF
jgi:hypothetical protein